MRRTLLALTVLLAACGQDVPESGLVLDRTFTAAHTETYYVTQCFSYNAQGMCTMSIPMPQTDHHPDRWHLFLENCDKTKKNGEPRCYKGYREVAQHVFDRFQIGDYFEGPTGLR